MCIHHFFFHIFFSFPVWYEGCIGCLWGRILASTFVQRRKRDVTNILPMINLIIEPLINSRSWLTKKSRIIGLKIYKKKTKKKNKFYVQFHLLLKFRIFAWSWMIFICTTSFDTIRRKTLTIRPLLIWHSKLSYKCDLWGTPWDCFKNCSRMFKIHLEINFYSTWPTFLMETSAVWPFTTLPHPKPHPRGRKGRWELGRLLWYFLDFFRIFLVFQKID